jgi:hypothetical protein
VQRLVPIEKMIDWLFYPDARAMTVGSKGRGVPGRMR